MVNGGETLFSNCVRNDTDVIEAAPRIGAVFLRQMLKNW